MLYQAVLSIEDQLKMFKEYIGKLEATVGKAMTHYVLTKSMFIVSMGSNDVSGTYFQTPYRKKEYDIEEYTSMIVNISSNFLRVCFFLLTAKC